MDTVASLYCDPAVEPGNDGLYRQKTEAERRATKVTVTIEKSDSYCGKYMSLPDLLAEHEWTEYKVCRILDSVVGIPVDRNRRFWFIVTGHSGRS